MPRRALTSFRVACARTPSQVKSNFIIWSLWSWQGAVAAIIIVLVEQILFLSLRLFTLYAQVFKQLFRVFLRSVSKSLFTLAALAAPTACLMFVINCFCTLATIWIFSNAFHIYGKYTHIHLCIVYIDCIGSLIDFALFGRVLSSKHGSIEWIALCVERCISTHVRIV